MVTIWLITSGRKYASFVKRDIHFLPRQSVMIFREVISIPGPAVHISPSDRQINRGAMVIGGSGGREEKKKAAKWNEMKLNVMV